MKLATRQGRLSDGSEPLLAWEFDDAGEWSAPSALKDSDGDALYQYRIQVCADGTFDVTASDQELGLDGQKTLGGVRAAVELCEWRERRIRDGMPVPQH